ncbi:hypothetical protein ACFPN7_38465 [Amycolatopsis halotolerans]
MIRARAHLGHVVRRHRPIGRWRARGYRPSARSGHPLESAKLLSVAAEDE